MTRLIMPGRVGFQMGNACCFPGTNQTESSGFMFRMWRWDADSDHARGDARERVPGLSRWAVGCGDRSGPSGLHLSDSWRGWPSDSRDGNGRTTHRMFARWAFTLHIPPWGASSQDLAAGVGLRTENCAGTTDAGDPAGVETIGPILLTPDGKTCVYGYQRTLSDLYLVEGLQ
jgi:hypothetical protein